MVVCSGQCVFGVVFSGLWLSLVVGCCLEWSVVVGGGTLTYALVFSFRTSGAP